MRLIFGILVFGLLGFVNGVTLKKNGGLSLLKGKNEITDVKFYLYNIENPQLAQELVPGNDQLYEESTFKPFTETKILAHGFTGSGLSGWAQDMKNKFFEDGKDINVIVVHWEKFAEAPWYDTAAENTRPVGQWTGSLLDHLARHLQVVNLDQIHLIGHSLGAHVSGFCGSWIGPRLDYVGRITGMDPAQPIFFYEDASGRLDPSDAKFVDIIHTAGGPIFANPPGLGFEDPIGHVDFYPNSGKPIQPGCGLDIAGTCSHSRAHQFFTESISSPTSFLSCKCESWEHYESGDCGCPEPTFMGDHTPSTASGLYFLKTNDRAPFSQS